MTDAPRTGHARIDGDRIAYQVLGEGPTDLVYLPATGEGIGARWEYQPYVSFLRRLAAFSRLIMFDRRGYGASDGSSGQALPTGADHGLFTEPTSQTISLVEELLSRADR